MKKLKNIKIREGNTGILYITDADGYKDEYIPVRDLFESHKLLFKFYELDSPEGKNIKECFWKDGYNWFPTTISLLHWQIIYMYVQYKQFFEKYPMLEYNYTFLNKSKFYKFTLLLSFNSSYKKF